MVLSRSEKSAEAIVGIGKTVNEGPNEEKSSAFVDVEGIASDARASGAVQRRAR
jgi:hypothetical protein